MGGEMPAAMDGAWHRDVGHRLLQLLETLGHTEWGSRGNLRDTCRALDIVDCYPMIEIPTQALSRAGSTFALAAQQLWAGADLWELIGYGVAEELPQPEQADLWHDLRR